MYLSLSLTFYSCLCTCNNLLQQRLHTGTIHFYHIRLFRTFRKPICRSCQRFPHISVEEHVNQILTSSLIIYFSIYLYAGYLNIHQRGRNKSKNTLRVKAEKRYARLSFRNIPTVNLHLLRYGNGL